MKHLHDTINHFTEEAESQEAKGMKHYGKALDPLDNYDWLQMASEELVDAYKYFHAERVKRDYVIQEIRDLTMSKRVNELLDYLEGKE